MKAVHPPESWYMLNDKASYSRTMKSLKR